MMMVSVVCLAALVSFACTANAAGEGTAKREKGMMKEDLMKDLNLTTEQREQLKVHREANKEGMKAIREEMKAKQKELRDEVAKAQTDMGKIDAIKASMKDLEAKLIDHRVDSILSLKKILSPEQFAQMNAKMEEMRAKHAAKWKERREGKATEKGEDMPPSPPEDE